MEGEEDGDEGERNGRSSANKAFASAPVSIMCTDNESANVIVSVSKILVHSGRTKTKCAPNWRIKAGGRRSLFSIPEAVRDSDQIVLILSTNSASPDAAAIRKKTRRKWRKLSSCSEARPPQCKSVAK